ncbi:hypothetical protein [Brevibacillus sp. DP1.3A]|uniref:hypothetical protein n=1 Tax=Brevibacillus sp. DP1.3A TaxID=2738867 RepID=UPI00156B0C07|nr:hypothetical protein [Brevibacillus sp. DP1.3A]UED72616.1 hypothetical protein HP399_017865 [Brevibacillus sp. DP1.3A]
MSFRVLLIYYLLNAVSFLSIKSYNIQLIREWTGLNAENGHDQMLLRIAITAHVIGHRH